MDIRGTVRVIYLTDMTVDYTVWLDTGATASGNQVLLVKAAKDIGMMFLKEGRGQ